MARDKVTITVDRSKLAEARLLLNVPSASAAVDLALSDVIRRARLRRDVDAYRHNPPTAEEIALAEAHPDPGDLADDTDWEAEWPLDA